MKIKEFLPGLSIAILISLLAWFLGNLFPIIGGPVLGLFIGLLLGIILRDSQKLKDRKCNSLLKKYYNTLLFFLDLD